MNKTLHARAATVPGKIILIAGVTVLYGCWWAALSTLARSGMLLAWSYFSSNPDDRIEGIGALWLALIYSTIPLAPALVRRR